jgi:hypothetical protein
MCVSIIGPLWVPLQLHDSALAGRGPWLPKSGALARAVNRSTGVLLHILTPCIPWASLGALLRGASAGCFLTWQGRPCT